MSETQGMIHLRQNFFPAVNLYEVIFKGKYQAH